MRSPEAVLWGHAGRARARWDELRSSQVLSVWYLLWYLGTRPSAIAVLRSRLLLCVEGRGLRRDTAWAMSEENVETVRRIFDSFAVVQEDLRRGDLPIGKPWAEDVEFDASDLGLPDLGD